MKKDDLPLLVTYTLFIEFFSSLWPSSVAYTVPGVHSESVIEALYAALLACSEILVGYTIRSPHETDVGFYIGIMHQEQLFMFLRDII
ncbi:hypothetical protein C8Q69DRAFT_479827 [Paecilomyces variotii]|uniref:Uncharacterized protein n=1 Tax=Byssochlamys spectabilis TaxID=264951 RepID=A0A443HJS1_BYSSP|nr:hypothetical protein C8Q69DRAFT_479827 [Paecilomyces variotii]RWQ92101.1 hypothetical protein C8Q69DRAFT_479827 [Paecilomyces variotii]